MRFAGGSRTPTELALVALRGGVVLDEGSPAEYGGPTTTTGPDPEIVLGDHDVAVSQNYAVMRGDADSRDLVDPTVRVCCSQKFLRTNSNA